MKYLKLIISIFIITFTIPVLSRDVISPESNQSASIRKIISSEKNRSHKENIVDIISFIDKTYTDIPERISNGEKITIFFDPAMARTAQRNGGELLQIE